MEVPFQTPPPIEPIRPQQQPIDVILPDGSSPVPLGSGVITSILGEGGAAIVYEIWNEQLGVKRAVKLLRPNAMPTTFGRFATEVRITAQLRHPNIIEVHAVGEWNRLPFIEMERLDGCSLDKLLTQRGALPVRAALAIGIMVCRALAYTHSHTYSVNDKQYKGVLHRDLKPANILIAENGMAKLMDFGLATPVNISMHTMEGAFVGSLQYLSPEQLEGKKASTSSDLYAFGSVMYEMLTGIQAFSESNMTKFVAERMSNEYRPLREFHLNIPARLIRLINTCMAFDREKRAQDAAEVCAELEAIYNPLCRLRPEEMVQYYLKNITARRSVGLRRRSFLIPIVSALLSVVLFVGLGYWAWTNRESLPLLSPTAAKAPAQIQPAVSETVFVTKTIPTPPADLHDSILAQQQTKDAALQKKADKAVRIVRQTSQPRQTQPVPAAPSPAPEIKLSVIASLAQKYGTGDLLAIMAFEERARGFSNALLVYDSLPAAQKQSKHAVLCKMRAMEGLNDKSGLIAFAAQHPVSDAEYYMIKARVFYAQHKYADALSLITSSQKSQAEFANPDAISREALYYRALCLTAVYGSMGSDENRTAAINAWFDVKYAFRSDQGHRYFIAANEQIRRMNRDQGGNN